MRTSIEERLIRDVSIQEAHVNRFMSDIEPASLALGVVILVVAALLGSSEWLDRLGRPTVLADDDRVHLQRRDRRRSFGLSILCVLALGIVIGSRLPIRNGPRANPWFLGIWLGVFCLILLLLGLALVDWVDLRRYAQRKKSAMGREHLLSLQSEIERWKNQNRDTDDLTSGGAGRES